MEYAVVDFETREILNRMLHLSSAHYAASHYRLSRGLPRGSLRIQVLKVPVGGDPFAALQGVRA